MYSKQGTQIATQRMEIKMANDTFLELDGVKGESLDKKYKEKIEIQSWSWGAHQTGTMGFGTGGGAGKVQIQDISFSKAFDRSSPVLLMKCATGTHIPKGKLIQRKAGGKAEEFLTIELKDIIVTSVSASGHGDQLNESLVLNFSEIKVVYKPQKEDGTLDAAVEFGWDAKRNVKA